MKQLLLRPRLRVYPQEGCPRHKSLLSLPSVRPHVLGTCLGHETLSSPTRFNSAALCAERTEQVTHLDSPKSLHVNTAPAPRRRVYVPDVTFACHQRYRQRGFKAKNVFGRSAKPRFPIAKANGNSRGGRMRRCARRGHISGAPGSRRRTADNSPDCEELARKKRHVRRKPKKHGAVVGVIVVPGSYPLEIHMASCVSFLGTPREKDGAFASEASSLSTDFGDLRRFGTSLQFVLPSTASSLRGPTLETCDTRERRSGQMESCYARTQKLVETL